MHANKMQSSAQFRLLTTTVRIVSIRAPALRRWSRFRSRAFRRMTLLSDPSFWPLAIHRRHGARAQQGRFSGVGMVAAPLLSLMLPPLQAAAIMIPIMIVQAPSRLCLSP